MEKTNLPYFETPTQVVWCDHEGYWEGGIAYKDEIICGCCGGVNSIQDIFDDAPDWVKCPIHTYGTWENISNEIQDGEYPDTFDEEPADEE